MIRLIAAVDNSLGIANDHGIPWQGQLPTDAKYFRDQTETGIVVMGFATYQEFDQPVHNRDNFVVTRPDTGELRTGFTAISKVERFLQEHDKELVWIIGGAGLFATTVSIADELFLTQLDRSFNCTKFFPKFSESFELTNSNGPKTENGISFTFQIWKRTTLLATNRNKSSNDQI